MSAKVCCHCRKPIVLADDAIGMTCVSSKVEINGKPVIVHEHGACQLKADQPLSRAAYEAIFEAEKAGIA